MPIKIVKEYYNQDKTRRVSIVDCGNGTFTFGQEKYSDDPHQQCWIDCLIPQTDSICSSFEIALREAKGRISWLGEMLDKNE